MANSAARTRLIEALLREIHGTRAEKLELFEALKAAGMLLFEDPAQVQRAEEFLRHETVGAEGGSREGWEQR